jgi:hypothetical protein
MKIAVWSAAASGWLLLLAGCGLAANPQPPTLWLPEPPKDLTAVRGGNEVHLRWTMPKDTTDKVPLKGDQAAHVCWLSSDAYAPGTKGPARPLPGTGLPNCVGAGDKDYPPGKPATFTAQLPAAFASGEPRAMAFYVELQNHAGKTAGPSNPAWVAGGAAPPAVMDLRLQTQAEGVVLHWRPDAPEPGMVLRIHRTLVAQPGASRPNQANGVPPPEQQTLEVDLDKTDAGQALDRDAALDHTWRYTAERVLRVNLEHHALEMAGVASQPETVDAKDVFPPAVPAGLAIVADEQGHALDLSWTPDSDSDLAGYVIYRRDVTAGNAAERISGKALVVPPSFHDKDVTAGHSYAYAVSAVDRDGNESAKSDEAEAELPQ